MAGGGPGMTFRMKRVSRIAAAAAGGGLLAFASVTALGGCRSCDETVPALPAVGAALLWGAAAVLSGGAAAGLGLFLLFGHVGLILSAPAPACLPCLVLLGIESVAAGLLISAIPARRLAVLAGGTVLAAAGLAGGWAVAWWTWSPSGPDPLGEYVREAPPPYGTVVFVVVRGDCGHCPDGVGLARSVEESGKARAVIVESWTEAGRRLRWEHRLRRLPAFVARRGSQVVAVQSGGGVEEFLARLDR